MNGLGKPFRKKSDPKNRKNLKNQSESAACDQKTSSKKAKFCSNTLFLLYLKIKSDHISRRRITYFFAPLLDSAWAISLL